MDRDVPYLAEKAIERDAVTLLEGYKRARAGTLALPIPVDDIVENYLELSLDFADMHERHSIPRPPNGQPDIIGAIYDDGSIFIDESLDPDDNPAREGRYRFTLAHEVGHWRLHSYLIIQDAAQISLFDTVGDPKVDTVDDPKFICRSSQAGKRVEWQANFYASYLLMPHKMICAVWDEFFPDRKPRVLQPQTPTVHSFVEIPRAHVSIAGFDISETEDEVLERFCKPLAEVFAVSPIAMRIRLEKLGLLHRVVPSQLLFASK